MNNVILQISHSNNNKTDYAQPIALLGMNIDDEITIPIEKKFVKLIKTQEYNRIVYIIDDLRNNQYVLSNHRPTTLKLSDESLCQFQLAEDFVTSDTNKFKKFIKYSLYFHLIAAIIVTIVQFFTPPQIHKTTISIDAQKIQELMEKIQQNRPEEKKEEVIIAEVEPPPPPLPEITPTQAPTPTPAPKVVEKKQPPPKLPPPPPSKKVAKKVKAPPKLPPPPPLAVQKVAKTVTRKKVHPTARQSKVTSRPKAKITSGDGKGRPQAIKEAKTKLASSLGFLSTGDSKFSVPPPQDGASDSRYKAAGDAKQHGIGGKKGGKNYLSKLVAYSGPSGEGGPIQTTGARGIATGKIISEGSPDGDPRSKALNSVQGKVSLSRLYDYRSDGNVGSAISGNHGMKMTGKGKVNQSEIEKILAKNVHKLQYCYEKALLFNSSLAGNLWAKWRINPGGTVSSARIIKSELNHNKLHECITQELSKIKFTSPQGGFVELEYPFNFSSTSL